MSGERPDDMRPRAADAGADAENRAAGLRKRFVTPPRGAAAAADCPLPARLWDAAHGAAPPGEIAALADHVAACAPCTLAWRIAREEALSAPGGARDARAGRSSLPSGRKAWIGLSAAAILLVAVAGLAIRLGAPALFLPSSSAPRLRSPADKGLVSLVPESAVLARTACVLRWSAAGPDARYRIEVTDERLGFIADAQGLEREEYEVPAEALRAVPHGGRILWRIEAERPGGWKASSPTFSARVE